MSKKKRGEGNKLWGYGSGPSPFREVQSQQQDSRCYWVTGLPHLIWNLARHGSATASLIFFHRNSQPKPWQTHWWFDPPQKRLQLSQSYFNRPGFSRTFNRMENRSRVRCPENQDLASYMSSKWKEMAEQPKGISENIEMALSKAHFNVCNSKSPIQTIKDFSQVKYVCNFYFLFDATFVLLENIQILILCFQFLIFFFFFKVAFVEKVIGCLLIGSLCLCITFLCLCEVIRVRMEYVLSFSHIPFILLEKLS